MREMLPRIPFLLVPSSVSSVVGFSSVGLGGLTVDLAAVSVIGVATGSPAEGATGSDAIGPDDVQQSYTGEIFVQKIA